MQHFNISGDIGGKNIIFQFQFGGFEAILSFFRLVKKNTHAGVSLTISCLFVFVG